MEVWFDRSYLNIDKNVISEVNIMVVLVLRVFVGPRVFFEEITDGLFNSNARIQSSCNRFTSEGISFAISLNMLLYCASFVNLTTVCYNGVFHQVQCNLTSEVIRYLENNTFIGCLDELLQFILRSLLIYFFIFLQIALKLWQIYYFVLIYCFNSSLFNLLELEVP